MNQFTLRSISKWYLILVFIFPFFVFDFSLKAGGDPAELVRQIELHIGQLYLDKAERETREVSDAFIRDYYLTRIRFYKVLLSDEPAMIRGFDSISDKAIVSIGKFPGDKYLRNAALSEIHMQRGAIRYLSGKTISAALEMRKACDFAFSTAGAGPGITQHFKMLGTFNVAMDAIPNNMKWLGNILCSRGNLEMGLDYLQQASKKGTVLPEEAEILLFFIEKNYLSESTKANERIQKLKNKHPDYYIYALIYALSCLENGKNDDALSVLIKKKTWDTNPEIYQSPLWYLFLGRAHLNKLEFGDASYSFNRYLKNHKGNTYHADAWFKLGLCYLLTSRDGEANVAFKKVIEMGESGFDSDSYSQAMAKRYLASPATSREKIFWSSRLLFDGGYFEKSQVLLYPFADSISIMTAEERTELYYRFGRNYFATGNMKPARFYLQQCMDMNASDSRWMSAYSGYFLGKIAEKEGKPDLAREFYGKVLIFNKYHYQSSIESKCKAALQNLKAGNTNPH